EPAGPRLDTVKVDTSVRKGEITVGAALDHLANEGHFALHARIVDGGRTAKEFTSREFSAGDLKDGRFVFTEKWLPGKLWDLHTPENSFDMELTLQDAGGKVLDAALPVHFGFREFWIEGRDFMLNGARIHLSAVPLDNAQVSVAASTYEAARESLKR